MEWSLSWEVSSHSASQDFSHLLWKPKVRYSVHKSKRVVISSVRWIQSTSCTMFTKNQF